MEIDKKTCLLCKKKIEDKEEYFCKECYEKSLEEAKQSELFKHLEKENLLGSFLALAIFSGYFDNVDKKGE